MKFFANRNIWKKIVIVLSLIFSMSFVKPAPVNAGLKEVGGELMEPICDLLVWLGDGALSVAHSALVHQETTIIRVDLNDGFTKIKRIIFTVGTFLAILAAAVVITVGGALVIGFAAAALGITVSTFSIGLTIAASVVPVAIKGGIFFGAKVWTSDNFDNEIDLPLYSISPERIFSNTVPFFDVNFFNPDSKPFEYEWIHKQGTGEKFDDVKRASGNFIEVTEEEKKLVEDYNILQNGDDAKDEVKGYLLLDKDDTTVLSAKKAILDGKTYYQYVRQTQMSKEEVMADKDIDADEAGVYYKTYIYRLRDASSTSAETSTTGGKAYALSYELANTVKFWYGIMKTLAIVGMMSVLVYMGIRILLSSTAEQQAKQKKLFGDWLIGMVLLFTMQYIMVFANIAVDHLTEMFKSINPMGQVAFIPDKDGLVEKELNKYNIQVSEDQDQVVDDKNMVVYKFQDKNGNLSDEKEWYIEWHTDLMGHLRIALQANANSGFNYIGYTIMYLAMVVYTAIFIFIYIKRVIYMAFLTVIAPLVALTYPIDKANDGSAQGFNYWFKEYIFNLLLQPVHLLTYTILVSTAIKFATTNWLYSLIVLGFITQAEKIVRQMFNFSKASTPGVFAGPAGAALAMSGIRWLMGRGPNGGPRGGKSSGGDGSNSEDDSLTTTGNKVVVKPDSLGEGGLLEQGDSNSSPSNPEQGDNSHSASVINSGNNGLGNGRDSTNNGLYQQGDYWDNFYGTNNVFADEDAGFEQTGDYWDNFYGTTNEFADEDAGFEQTGDYWDNFYGTTNEFVDGDTGNDQIDENENDIHYTDELTDGETGFEQSGDYGDNFYGTNNEFADGDIRFDQNGENWNDFYDTDEFAEDDSSSNLGRHRSGRVSIGSGSLGSSGRLPSASTNTGSSGFSTPNTTRPNNNQGQTRTTNSGARNNGTTSRRRLPITNGSVQGNEGQRRQVEQNQNGSPQRRQVEQNQNGSPQRRQVEQRNNNSPQRTQGQVEQPARLTKKRSREEIEAIRREREQNNPIIGRALNIGGRTKDGIGALAGNYVNNTKRSIKKSLKEGRPGKAVSRTISGVAGAAFFGTAAVAATIASGDAKTVATGAVAGVAGGYKAGTGIGNAIDNVVKSDEVPETFLKGYLGEDEYREKIVEANKKEKALDSKRIKRIMDKKGMSKKDAEKYATQPEHYEYMENKIDDIDDWFALDALTGKKILNADGSESGSEITTEHAIAIYKEYKRSGMDSKDHEKAIKKIMSDFGLKEDSEQDKATAEKWYQNMKLLDDIINS